MGEQAKRWIIKRGFGFSAIVIIAWPLLCLAAGVFSEGFFSFWVFISLVWGFAAAAVVICLPIWESRASLSRVAHALLGWTSSKSDDTIGCEESASASSADDATCSDSSSDNNMA